MSAEDYHADFYDPPDLDRVNEDRLAVQQNAKCEHRRTSTNRTPKTITTWCLDCGKVLEKVAR